MRRISRAPRWLLLGVAASVLATGCGKKGNPLPPLQRLPTAPADLTATRIEDDVFLRFVVPTVNVDGQGPADVSRVELYAISASRPPQTTDDFDAADLRVLATLVGREEVRRPLPLLPPIKEGMPAPPPLPRGAGVDPGAVVMMRERLSDDLKTAVPIPVPSERATPEPAMAMVAPFGAGDRADQVQRYYYAVAVSSRGRYGPASGLVPAPLGATTGPPSAPVVTVTETTVSLRWNPPQDVRGVAEPSDPTWLPSRPLFAGPPPTTYDVYEVSKNAAPVAPVAPAAPVPLTPAPVAATTFTQENITLGAERCFSVRSVDILNGIHVRGPASPPACASFADTFAPPPPSKLAAVAVPGAVELIWEPSDAKDLAGYLVLRGGAGGDTLTPLNREPTAKFAYRDDTTKPGERYVYAIVAVDRTGNRSAESNRVDETARQ